MTPDTVSQREQGAGGRQEAAEALWKFTVKFTMYFLAERAAGMAVACMLMAELHP
jgi:hypothetical protein